MSTVSRVVSRYCPLCGQPIPQGETNCPYCSVPKLLKLSREGVLIGSFVLLPLFFTFTGFVTRFYHAKEQALAQEWFASRAASAQFTFNARVRDLPSRGPLHFLYPDQSLEEAMRMIGEWPIVPVLNRAHIEYLEGVISLEDILHAYRKSAKA